MDKKNTQLNGALFSSTWQRKKKSNNLGNFGSNNYIAQSGKVPFFFAFFNED